MKFHKVIFAFTEPDAAEIFLADRKAEGWDGDIEVEDVKDVKDDESTNTFDAAILDDVSRDKYEMRVDIGRTALNLGDGEGDETDASDVISDILTCVYGPAGYTTAEPEYERQPRPMAINDASELLNRALRSWLGDAEDYSTLA